MAREPEASINCPRVLHTRWLRTKRSLGLSNARLIEVLLNRWETSTPDEQGEALLMAPRTKPMRRQPELEPANA
jgi:hypothetical protein